ncbi:hypothetical protein [Clostridium saudiense]|uniref:hypothetical protein n=1 Tax=Clostridium saudiense TaxID=1414720 RepID=UPI0004B544C8|nr:hypothetical protein [Clostridium saudiense]
MVNTENLDEECIELEEGYPSLDDLMLDSIESSDGVIESTVSRNNSNSDFIEILNIWKTERQLELGLKKIVCKALIALIFIEAIFIGVMVGLQGAKIWSFEEWTFRLIIVSVFAEIVGVFIIVVKSLFPEDSSKSMLDLIKHIYGNNRRDS